MNVPTTSQPEYAISKKALRRWAKERLRSVRQEQGEVTFRFNLNGSTCSNMGLPINAEMIVDLDSEGRIANTAVLAGEGDVGLEKMCAAKEDGEGFIRRVGSLEEAHGMTVEEAAFHSWDVAPSGCFCSHQNRLHKWRNVFQTIHFASSS